MWEYIRKKMCIAFILYLLVASVEGGNIDQSVSATGTTTPNAGIKQNIEIKERQESTITTKDKDTSVRDTCTNNQNDPCIDDLHMSIDQDNHQPINQGQKKYTLDKDDTERTIPLAEDDSAEDQMKYLDKEDQEGTMQAATDTSEEDQIQYFDKKDHLKSADTDIQKILVYSENESSDMKEPLSEIIDAYQIGGPARLLAYMRSSLENWKGENLNIGVTGRSGVGKSSFINTMRGLTAESMGAAETGATETTREAEAYPHPDNKQLVFWDLPGIGTENFPRETYFKDERIEFDRYDMFLILSNGRFFEDDYLLAKKAKRSNRLFLFVRTKVDVDVHSEKKSKPLKFRKDPKATESLLGQIREEVVEALRGNKLYTEDSVFLIDCLDMTWTHYDFGKLTKKLIAGFHGLKREAFILTLNILQPNVLEQKVAVLRNRIWKVSVISAIGAVAPLPGFSFAVDVALILEEAFFYMKQLGISEKHIAWAADIAELDVKEFTSLLDLKTVDESWTTHGVATYMAKYEAAETVVKLVMPGAGSLIASGISYRTTFVSLNGILDMMSSDANKLHSYMLSLESFL